MATMIDVAKLANVSYQTVSRVINDSPDVSVTTRERVLSAIKTLQYYPSQAARNMQRSTPHSIGLSIPGSLKMVRENRE